MPELLDRLKTALADRYAIEREIGAGGMATVYLAQDLKHDRHVAIKVLRPELAAAIGPERFLREIKITAQLNHPHILPLLDSGDADGFLYYVMPYMEGESLRDKLNREKELGIDVAVKITEAVASALDYAHGHDVIHRDIKPENILLQDGQALVADFGIALAVHSAGGQRLTETGFSLGTPEYMSPEQVSADRELDARSDVYSLACVVYEMLAGEPPHTGPTAQAVLAKVLTEEPRRLTAARTTVPEDVEYAVHKALATLPVDRFSTCSEFAKALTDPRLAPVPATRLAPRAEPAVSAAGAWQDKPSLAVLPFVNLSGDPEEDYFASGLTTDIMADLVRISGLFLVSRDSMFTYKDKSVSVRQVGRELGVHNVLEGTVRKAAKRVRITAQLVDAQSGRHIWAERYDCDLDDLFAVQDEINEEIVTALDVKLLSGEVARIFRKSLRNPRARDRYYLGLDLSYRWTKESNAEARALFSEVIQMEPECVWGYIWLAFAHYLDSAAGWSESSSASMDSAMELAHKALEVGDVTGMARLLIAQFHLFNGEHDTALMAAARALEERPSCPGAYSLHANILNYSGTPAEAISPAKQAIRLTPRYPAWYPAVLAAAYYLAGRRDEAMDAATSAMALAPENLDVHLMLAAALAASGRTDKAKATVKEILNIDPGFTLENFSKRQPYKDPAVLESVTADLRAAGLT